MMNVFNIKLLVATLLRDINEFKTVSTDYPTKWDNVPIAIYRTSSTPFFVDAHSNELQTKWRVTIEVYSNKSLASLVKKVEERFEREGISLKRKDSNTAVLKRVVLDAEFIVDNTIKVIYDK